MQKPKFVTLTGADDNTDIDQLFKISDQYPFVEWGILYSASDRKGTARYPSLDWLQRLQDAYVGMKATARYAHSANFAIHICGTNALDQFFSGNAILELYMFDRIQLNFNSKKYSYQTSKSHTMEEILMGNLIFSKKKYQDIIILDNQNNSDLVDACAKFPEQLRPHILFDASGGRGIPSGSLHYRPEFFCGQAGGIGPDNIKDVLTNLSAVVPEDREYWIDMESSLRTVHNSVDIFDLVKCYRVLQTVEQFFTK